MRKLLFFKRKNVGSESLNRQYRALCKVYKKIYRRFVFNGNDVVVKIEPESSTSLRLAYPKNGMFFIRIGIKEYLNKELTDAEIIEFQNAVYHELTHAKNYFTVPYEIKTMIDNPRRTYAFWALKLVDEYIAYKESNALYPEREENIKSSEAEILGVFKHFCCPLKGGTDAAYFDAYYDLGTAFVAHKFMNKKFPSIDNVCYKNFVKAFIGHIEDALEREMIHEWQYHMLGVELMKDFEILYDVIKIPMLTDFRYFKLNSRME